MYCTCILQSPKLSFLSSVKHLRAFANAGLVGFLMRTSQVLRCSPPAVRSLPHLRTTAVLTVFHTAALEGAPACPQWCSGVVVAIWLQSHREEVTLPDDAGLNALSSKDMTFCLE